MEKPLISICIPTRNHCKMLMKSIESIISQPEFTNGKVEIVVSDNASDDETYEVLNCLKEKYSNIVYHRNEKDIYDCNFPCALNYGNGVLRKLSNDSLVYYKDSLKEMCDIVEHYKEIRPVILWTNGNCSYAPKEILDFGTFVSYASFWVTWIGAFSIWDDECSDIQNDTYGCEKQLWQVRKMYEIAEKRDKAIIVDVIHGIKYISENVKDVSYGIYHVFYENYMFFLKLYLECGKLSNLEFEIVERDLLYNFLTDWMVFWETKNPKYKFSESENLVDLVTSQYKNKQYWSKYEQFYKFRKILLNNSICDCKQELTQLVTEIDEWTYDFYDVIYLALKHGVDLIPAVERIRSCDFKTIFSILASRHEDFAGCVLEYGVPEVYFCSIKKLLWMTTLFEEAAYRSQKLDDAKRYILISMFIELTCAYITNIYTPELLNDEDVEVLPELHQFGYYMLKANKALLNGDNVEYIHILEKAVRNCKEMSEIIKFILMYFKNSLGL